jgi:hypothetical protein
MAGDYTKFQRHYGNLTTDFEMTALVASPQPLLVPRNANAQVFIQSAELVVTIYQIAIVKLIGHTSGRVYAMFNVPAAPSSNNTDIFRVDYGPTGLGANIGETIDVSWSNATLDAFLHVEAYNRLAVVLGSNIGPKDN